MIFGQSGIKTVAVCHLGSIPNDSFCSESFDMLKWQDVACQDARALDVDGIDSVLLTNEFSMPYGTQADSITVAMLSAVANTIHKELSLPIGIDCMYDAQASAAIAIATGSSFIRFYEDEVNHIGVASNSFRDALHLTTKFGISTVCAMHCNGDSPREVAKRIRSIAFFCRPDAFAIASGTVGEHVEAGYLGALKHLVPEICLFADGGISCENVAAIWGNVDGVIVGTSLKAEGLFEAHVDTARVIDFVKAVRKAV